MEKLVLVRPSEEYVAEICAYRDELRTHDTHSHGDSGLYDRDDVLEWIKFCRDMESVETLPSPDYVEADQFMLLREGEPRILGMINLRRHLKEGYLTEHGGHIGYGVRPTERRKGYAKAMLAQCLDEARALGLSKVLICCDLDNAGSRGTIIANGGQFDRLGITNAEVDERYWINLTEESPTPLHSDPDTMHEAQQGHSEIAEYYTNQYNEEDRFVPRRGLVEYLTTMRYIEKYLTTGVTVVEIGAGTGRYSRTISDQGHKVEAVELVPANIETFRQNLKPGQDITITQANALDLHMFATDTFDLTLLLGPLYHLYTTQDKHQAIAEAIRITKPGGIIFAAHCQSDAPIINSGFTKNYFPVKEYVKSGKIHPQTFATTSTPEDIFDLVRKEDIDNLMAPFPTTRLHYVATDLFTHWMADTIDQMDDETYALYLRYHFATCERPDITGASHHVLDVFVKGRADQNQNRGALPQVG